MKRCLPALFLLVCWSCSKTSTISGAQDTKDRLEDSLDEPDGSIIIGPGGDVTFDWPYYPEDDGSTSVDGDSGPGADVLPDEDGMTDPDIADGGPDLEDLLDVGEELKPDIDEPIPDSDCTPSCGSKECGSDGCGRECGY